MALIYNERSIISPEGDLNRLPLFFTVTDTNGAFIKESNKIFSLKTQYRQFFIGLHKNGTPYSGVNQTEISLEKCDPDRHFREYKYLFNKQLPFDSLFCIPPEINIKLYGLYGDSLKGYSMFRLFINKCINDTIINNNTCADKELIDKVLTSTFLTMGSVDYDVNPNNYDIPLNTILKPLTMAMSSTVYSSYLLYKQNILVNTDIGFIFSINREDTGFSTKSLVYNVDLRTNSNATVYHGGFGQVTFVLSEKYDYYDRSYTKLQELIANIGGVMETILMFGGLIVNLYTENDFLSMLIVSNFETSLKKKNDYSRKLTSFKLNNINASFNNIINNKLEVKSTSNINNNTIIKDITCLDNQNQNENEDENNIPGSPNSSSLNYKSVVNRSSNNTKIIELTPIK
jgi:hypothetical protein